MIRDGMWRPSALSWSELFGGSAVWTRNVRGVRKQRPADHRAYNDMTLMTGLASRGFSQLARGVRYVDDDQPRPAHAAVDRGGLVVRS